MFVDFFRRGSEQFAELFRGKSGILGDATHGGGLDFRVAGDDESLATLAHDDVPALPDNRVAEFLKHSHGVFLSYA